MKDTNNSASTLKIYLERFREALITEVGATHNTITAYITDIKIFLRFILEYLSDITKINKKDILLFIENCKDKPSTISRKISSIKKFFSLLLLDGDISNNPADGIKLPKTHRKQPPLITENIVQKLLDGIHAVYSDNEYILKRNIALLELLYSTGIRVSELITLKISNVIKNNESLSNIKEKQTITINNLKQVFNIIGKGGKERYVILTESSMHALANYLSIRNYNPKIGYSEWVFHSGDNSEQNTHITRQRVGQIIQEICRYSNIEKGMLSPHKLRHAFATHILKNGGKIHSVQKLLGHSSITSTQIYTAIIKDHLLNTLLNKHPLFTKKDTDQTNNKIDKE